MCFALSNQCLKEICAVVLRRIANHGESVQTIRSVCRSLATAIVLFASVTNAQEVKTLPPWTPVSSLEYSSHQHRFRGNAAYVVMPDGTTMLIDAGEADQEFIESVAPLKPYPAKPNAQHSAGYWIAEYIRRFSPSGSATTLDFALITHFHTDHIGTLRSSSPLSSTGAYRLAGITEVADLIEIKTLVDRAAPDYKNPLLSFGHVLKGMRGAHSRIYLDMAGVPRI